MGKMWSLPSVPGCSIPHSHIDQLDVRGCFAPPNSESVKSRGFIPAHALLHGCFQPGEVVSFPATKLRLGDTVRPSPGAAVGDRKPGVKGLSPTPAPGMGVPSETLFLKKKGLREGAAGGQSHRCHLDTWPRRGAGSGWAGSSPTTMAPRWARCLG